MSGINIKDVKISFGGIELTPLFISQSLKDAKTTFSTLREELPKRINQIMKQSLMRRIPKGITHRVKSPKLVCPPQR